MEQYDLPTTSDVPAKMQIRITNHHLSSLIKKEHYRQMIVMEYTDEIYSAIISHKNRYDGFVFIDEDNNQYAGVVEYTKILTLDKGEIKHYTTI